LAKLFLTEKTSWKPVLGPVAGTAERGRGSFDKKQRDSALVGWGKSTSKRPTEELSGYNVGGGGQHPSAHQRSDKVFHRVGMPG